MAHLACRLLRDEDGPTAVEYAIMVAAVALVVLAAAMLFGESVVSLFDKANEHL